MKVFEVGDFARIKGNKGQLPHDSVVYIAGSTLIPVDEKDPYKRQLHFIVGEIKDGKIVLEKSYVVLPYSLKAVSPQEEAELEGQVEVQFKGIEEGSE